jgi:hypothetical protein
MKRAPFIFLLGLIVACAEAAVVSDDTPGDGGGADATDANACTSMCNGTCADLKTDPANCGKCGATCPMGATCVQGSCQCGVNQARCGNACVDLKTDIANCGKCGAACGGDGGMIMGGGTWGCANGACAIMCPAPKSECNGACVDTKTDFDNCGMCNNACMMGETCTGGICCTMGLTNCSGMCTDTQYDAKNCNMCGNVCPNNAPYCNKGTCTQCDNTVLLLADGNSGPSGAFQTKANQAGLAVTLVTNGVTTYTGNPAASNFAVTMVMVGDSYATDMPGAGQSAITSAQSSGRGVVVTDWGGYEVYTNHWSTLKSVNLATYTTGSSGSLAFTLTQMNHPLWSGLPNSFTGTTSQGCQVGSITNSGTAIANISGPCSGPGVVVRTSPGGRIVYLADAASWNGNTTWPNDTNMVNLTINALKWATGCLL